MIVYNNILFIKLSCFASIAFERLSLFNRTFSLHCKIIWYNEYKNMFLVLGRGDCNYACDKRIYGLCA